MASRRRLSFSACCVANGVHIALYLFCDHLFPAFGKGKIPEKVADVRCVLSIASTLRAFHLPHTHRAFAFRLGGSWRGPFLRAVGRRCGSWRRCFISLAAGFGDAVRVRLPARLPSPAGDGFVVCIMTAGSLSFYSIPYAPAPFDKCSLAQFSALRMGHLYLRVLHFSQRHLRYAYVHAFAAFCCVLVSLLSSALH